MSAPAVSPFAEAVVALPEAPPPDVPVQDPWYVNEITGPWPAEVADGTWPQVHPHIVEGPHKVTSSQHSVEEDQARHALGVHGQILVRDDDVALFWLNDVDLQWRIDGRPLRRQPDIMVFRQWPLDFDPIRDRYLDLERYPPPDLVLEFLSLETWAYDVGRADVPPVRNKKRFYAAIGVQEYWIVNPLDIHIRGHPRLQGFALNPVTGQYARIAANSAGRLRSEVLDTDWGVDDQNRINLWDTAKATWYEYDHWRRDLDAKDTEIAEKDAALAEKDAALAEKRAALAEKRAALAEKSAALAEKDAENIQNRVETVLALFTGFGVLQDTAVQAHYRAQLRALAPDQIPTVTECLVPLQEHADSMEREDAVKTFLNRVLAASAEER